VTFLAEEAESAISKKVVSHSSDPWRNSICLLASQYIFTTLFSVFETLHFLRWFLFIMVSNKSKTGYMARVQSPQYWGHGKKSHGPTKPLSLKLLCYPPIFLSSHLAVVFTGVLVKITMNMTGTWVDTHIC
jgi:hypothetical protein